jgi:hypothetical protein
MSNFIETYKKGKEGKNFGLDTGIPALNKAINGLQKKTSIGLAAAPKVGKTTLCDFSFVISPYLQMEALGRLDDIEWIYFSYEIDRISKEFKFAAFFFAHDHNVHNFIYKGKVYSMSGTYLQGKLLHENSDGTIESIRVSDEHEAILKEVYAKRIVPLFGEYGTKGEKIKPGKIDFIEAPENPTGLNKYLWSHAKQNGSFIEEDYKTVDEQGQPVKKKRVVGYTPNNPEKFTIIITDHIRKLRRERGFTMKENIDKWLEYSTILRNLCYYTFIHIIHSNRNMANVDRLKYAGEFIFPTADDCKDSGNPAEECTIFMTLFNPNDEKYNITKHFGVELQSFPNYRSLHITESRETDCPVHMQLNMFGGTNIFTPLLIKH